MALERELETYRRERQKLLTQEGKFALVHGDEVAGVWDTYDDALQAGYTRYGLEPFLVKKVEAAERVQFFTRDVGPCRS
jgi:hypothetical protein